MKKFIIGLCLLALPLGACTTPVSLQPATYANKTAGDEFTAVTAELAYKSWRLAATTGVQTGLIKGSTAAHVAALDNKLYAALTIVESAYASANATSIEAAVSNFNVILNESYGAIGGK
jgi:hypothetical protein